MTNEEQEARTRLDQLQRAIEKFNKARLKTEAYARGLKPCRIPREQVAATIQSMRDQRAEEEAARQLADLQRIMLGREPTPGEAAAGLSAGMSGPWLVAGVVAGVAAGAWVLTSIFSYLASHEERIQRELNPGAMTTSDILGWIVPAVVVGGVLVGGYYLLRDPLGSLFDSKPARPARMRRERLARSFDDDFDSRQTTPLLNPAPDDDNDEEGDE